MPICNALPPFDLLPHITFGATAERVEPYPDGGWLVLTQVNGVLQAEHFDGVAVCSGQFQKPLMPAIKGLDRFQGPVLHTLDYATAAPFQGKRVVCVGLGESGADTSPLRTISLFRTFWPRS